MFGVSLRRNLCSGKPVFSLTWSSSTSSRTTSSYSSTPELQKYLKKLKLGRFECFEKRIQKEPCVEILRNLHEELDVVHVRKRQPHVLYLRTELLLQRISFLKPIGITSRQKRKIIERNPPALVFDFDPNRADGSRVGYVRGVVRNRTDRQEVLTHILHPCSSLIVMRSFDLRNRVEFIQEQLGMAQSTLLQFLLNMPCFLLHNKSAMLEDFHFIHKHVLPQGFDLDHHTAELYPLVYAPSDNIHPSIFTTAANENTASALPVLKLSDVLDYSYKENHGKGEPEDLVEFLTQAELRELRPRYNKVM
ncbi:uncharacterized protein LOC116297907 [Actinia tenebrosa]|uniref:Uncharacterized protein LOC116297907 n=1 Tax=Actinia tenebrosa TaxID=6105 RepID=A0A6P8I2Q3_ACTTE|nr:uncharacterized protein LOC116297907 [Actinia tenebrosa]